MIVTNALLVAKRDSMRGFVRIAVLWSVYLSVRRLVGEMLSFPKIFNLYDQKLIIQSNWIHSPILHTHTN